VGVNRGGVPVSVVLMLEAASNVASDVKLPVAKVVAPHDRVTLASLRRRDDRRSWKFSLRSHWTPGAFTAGHDPQARYRLPYPDERAYRIGQAAEGPTHTSPESRYAVDFTMPEGTPILAARRGIVIAVTWKHTEGGRREDLKTAANEVRVLHPDGTIGTYGHLRAGGVAVRPGEAVAEGQVIGYSGSTGYSTGPHLHFVVTRVALQDGVLGEVSLPVRFYVGHPPRMFEARKGMEVRARYRSGGEGSR
jgi:murein DD-endopeptidase MepM/ murein hydrolase activator NlpD